MQGRRGVVVLFLLCRDYAFLDISTENAVYAFGSNLVAGPEPSLIVTVPRTGYFAIYEHDGVVEPDFMQMSRHPKGKVAVVVQVYFPAF